MPICNAMTKAGTPCQRNAKDGNQFCGIHGRGLPTVLHTCGVVKTNGHVCGKSAVCPFANQWVCRFHFNIQTRRIYADNMDELWEDLWEEYWNSEITLEGMIEEVETAYREDFINQRGFRLLMRAVEGLRFFEDQPDNERPEGLAGLATDPQSVHTTVVAQQTNRGMDVLLKQPVPEGHDTIAQLPLTFRKDKQVLRDMQRWYKQTFCKEIDDSLYRKVLDGLWCLIQTRPEKDELIQRLYEEARESLSMCCEGHLSRLCNVMVGFDDRFEPPVPVGEILQQKIANIAKEDIAVEDKVERAVYVFRELQIPMEEWDVWVDAF